MMYNTSQHTFSVKDQLVNVFCFVSQSHFCPKWDYLSQIISDL